jgi:hypothetical protein
VVLFLDAVPVRSEAIIPVQTRRKSGPSQKRNPIALSRPEIEISG